MTVIKLKIAETQREKKKKVQDKRETFKGEGKSLLIVPGNCIRTIPPRGVWKKGGGKARS